MEDRKIEKGLRKDIKKTRKEKGRVEDNGQKRKKRKRRRKGK